MTIRICGIPYKVVEVEDSFNDELHLGMIDYTTCEIKVNKNFPEEMKKEILCHETVHGILMHLGYNEINDDEQFVQSLGNAISQTFVFKDSEDSRHRKRRKKEGEKKRARYQTDNLRH